MNKNTARIALVGVASLSLLGLAACGASELESGGDGPATQDGDQELTTVEVGTLPVNEAALLLVGEEQGFFADQGLALNLNYAQGGAAIVPAVVSGQYQLGYSNAVSVYQAMEQDLPLSLLNVSATSNADPDLGTNDLLVRGDGSIKSAADLEGKKVAVNTLGNLSDVLAKNAIDAEGGDSSKVTFVELGFGDMAPALESGEIDAFLAGEPFGTIAKSQGAETLINTHQEISHDAFVFGVWFVNTTEADADPELYEAMQTAIAESNEYATAHLDEVREMVPEVTPIDPDVLESITMNGYDLPLTPEGLEPLAAASVTYDLLKAEPDYDAIIWKKP